MFQVSIPPELSLRADGCSGLQPGGWVEFQDFDIDYYSQDGSLTKDHAMRRWLDFSYDAAKQTGRTLQPGKMLEGWANEAGFVNVQVVKTPLPLGSWPKDPRLVCWF